MLWGQNRVSPGLYRLSVWLVAGGTTLSLFWILVLNSWMHTPTGFEMVDGKVVATDWLAIIFNPSMPYRTVHMFLASMLTAAFFVMGVSAYRLLQGHTGEDVRRSLKLGATMAAVVMPLQIVAGDMHGLNTHEHQPAKIAAMEGIWHTEKGVPLLLFAIPDDKARTNHFEVPVPKVASLIITHDLDGEIKGLNEFEGEHPPVLPVFWGFRVMVGSGMLMLALSWAAVWFLRRRGELPTWLLRVLVPATFLGWVPTLAGWYVTEIGRQPFLVSGVLRTADAVTKAPASIVAGSLATYLALYAVLLLIYIATLFYMARSGGGHHGYATPAGVGAHPATA
jgi:cytochrome d ubiquinol oxidase subunit I